MNIFNLQHNVIQYVVGVPASSLSQLRGPWPENVEDPCSSGFIKKIRYIKLHWELYIYLFN